MTTYEHKIVPVRDLVGLSDTLSAVQDGMNKLGAEGWQLVAILGDQAAVFVREVVEVTEVPIEAPLSIAHLHCQLYPHDCGSCSELASFVANADGKTEGH